MSSVVEHLSVTWSRSGGPPHCGPTAACSSVVSLSQLCISHEHAAIMDDCKGKRELDEEDNLERKHKRHHVARSVARRWTVNASIRETDQSRCYYLVPRLQTASMDCLTAVENHQ